KPLLSWRVRLLPFVAQDHLWKQFHLNEPWDSPHNRPLIRKIPRYYRCYSCSCPTEEGFTPYLIPRGDATVLAPGSARDWRDIPGDPSRTIAIVEVDAEHAAVWSKPGDFAYDPAVPHRGLGSHHRGDFLSKPGCFAVFADGSVRFVAADADEDLL